MAGFIRELDSQKWCENSYKEDSFVLTLADMDFPLYQPFKKSILHKLSLVNNFTYKNLSEQFYKSIIQWYKMRHIRQPKNEILKEHIVQTPSTLNIIFLVLQNYMKEGDGVLLMTPIYNYYDRICKYLKLQLNQCKLYNEKVGNISRYDINYTDLQQKAKLSRVLIFCNPHNPTGRIWNQKEVERIVKICEKHDILIISDQIMCDLVPQQSLAKFYSLVNSSYSKIIVCNSTSKAFNVSSLKGGYAIIKNPTIRNNYKTVANQLNLKMNEFICKCTQIFYSQEGVNWINYSLGIIKQNFNYLIAKTKNTLLVVSELQAAYIITISFEGYAKFIERWYNGLKEKEVQPKHMVSYFLGKQNIKGIQMIYASQHGILSDIRFTIAVEQGYFRRFVDKLTSSLFEIEYQHRQIYSKL